ncbi:hypothetical protein N7449_003919 [Penicillium cf. viridicatum]|uniref:Uncharacterized protein n=1 Tax=Penicillium cf. viridicatum TaxID=2972119 RepID=A0A9W9T5Q6_9EURO|nr:hypothetical protein N7449_003919 [Penicillium cf. viridicatum]
MTNIDQRLLEPQTISIEPPSNQPGTDTLMSAVGSRVTNIDLCSTEIATSRKNDEASSKEDKFRARAPTTTYDALISTSRPLRRAAGSKKAGKGTTRNTESLQDQAFAASIKRLKS